MTPAALDNITTALMFLGALLLFILYIGPDNGDADGDGLA
jgi:hypothetical protein